MESAGRGVAALVATRFPELLRQGVLVAAGTGNNGGDGWVAARALHAAGVPVWVAAAGEPGAELPRAVAGLAREAGVREVAPDGPWPTPALILDAVLGAGASGAPRGVAAALLTWHAYLASPVGAVDGPSGPYLPSGGLPGQISTTPTDSSRATCARHLQHIDSTP